MRTLENTFVPVENDFSDVVINDVLSLERNIAFFNNRLHDLQYTIANTEACSPAARSLWRERQTLDAMINTMREYITSLESTQTLGLTRGKLNDTDIAILHAKAEAMEKMRQMITPQNTNASDQLSQLIEDANTLSYTVPAWKKWLRRGAQVMGGLLCAGLAISAVIVLMTPGVNIVVIGSVIAASFLSSLAFWKLHAPVSSNMTIHSHATGSVGPFPFSANTTTNINVPIPSTIGVGAAGIYGACQFFKVSKITSPARETSAEKHHIAHTNHCIGLLKKKIQGLSVAKNSAYSTVTRALLLTAVEQADRLLNSGATGWFYETRDNKMKKARLILKEVAKIVEKTHNEPLTVTAIMNHVISSSHYTFGDLLNAQCDRSSRFFDKKESTTADALKAFYNMAGYEKKCVSLSVM